MSVQELPQVPVLPDGRFDVFVGFDLGHGETCLVSVQAEGDQHLTPLEVNGAIAFPTAIARVGEQYEVGRAAVDATDLEYFDIAFKTRPLTGTNWIESQATVREYAQVCYQKVKRFLPDDPNEVCFLIGCPTAWSDDAVEEYRKTFVDAGLPHPLVLRESWAALIHARDSEQIPKERLTASIVVIDIGSSTTDVTCVDELQVKDVVTVEYDLGAGLIDEYILQGNLEQLSDRGWWEEHFARDSAERRRALFVARDVKERYFNAIENKRDRGVRVIGELVKDLTLNANRKMMESAVYSHRYESLGKKTWADAYRELLQKVRVQLGSPPAFVLVGGGASRMDFTATIWKEIFGEEAVAPKQDPQPSTTVASGLARFGRWLQRCRQFDEQVERTLSVEVLTKTVESELPEHLKKFLKEGVLTLLKQGIPECIDRWRNGEIGAADGIAETFIRKGKEWESSDEARQLLEEPARHMVNLV